MQDNFKSVNLKGMEQELILIGILATLSIVLTIMGALFFKRMDFRKSLFFESVSLPLFLFVWLSFISLAVNQVDVLRFFSPYLFPTGICFLLMLFFLRLLKGIEKRLLTGQYHIAKFDKTSAHALFHISKWAVSIVTILFLMPIFKIPISGILAFGGAAGVGISLAAKDMLSNFLGGFMVILDRPFSIGDTVRSWDSKIEGVVEEIGWRMTMIRTFDKRPLYVPNLIFLNLPIENGSQMTGRRCQEFFYLTLESLPKVPAIVEKIDNELKKHQNINQSEMISVRLLKLNGKAPAVQILFHAKEIKLVEYEALIEEVLLMATKIVHEENAELAFPIIELKT